jgi:hypothetical protein
MQIGRRVQRLERAQHAADRQTKRKYGINDEGMGKNLDAHYDVPSYRNEAVNIYNFVRTHHEDPAVLVRLLLISKSIAKLSNVRLSFQS